MNNPLKQFNRPLLLLVLFNMVPQVSLRPLWVTATALIFVTYRLWLEFRDAPMPHRFLIWTAQAGVAAMIWGGYGSFIGDEAGGALLTLLLTVKIFELNRSRDYFVVCILCLLVLMSCLLLDQGLLMTAFLGLDLLLILAFLMAFEERRWSWKPWWPILRPALFLLLKTLPLVVLIFVLFPRFSTGFGNSHGDGESTGMTDSLRPGSLAKLIPSDDLIFRATFLSGDIPPLNQLYWRGAVLDLSNGMNWNRSPSTDRRVLPPLSISKPDIEVFLEQGSDRYLFSLDNTGILSIPNEGNPVHPRPGGIFELMEPLQTRERYLLQRGQFHRQEDLPLTRYLQTEAVPSAKMRQFLQRFAHRTTGETVSQLLDYFHRGGYGYSLAPPPAHDLDEFMFKTKIGFCEHFAGSFATLLRDLHIPARVVVGFQGGTPSFLDNYITVRGEDAHAWVEYYDEISHRWHRVDPTSEVAPLRLVQGSDNYFQEESRWMPGWFPRSWIHIYLRSRAFVDDVEASWIGFLLHFDLSRQRELLSHLGLERAVFRALTFFLMLGMALVLAVLYSIQYRRSEPLPPEERIYRQLQGWLRRWGIHKQPQEGPLAFLHKVEAAQPRLVEYVAPILEQVILARYANQAVSLKSMELLKDCLRGLKKLSIKIHSR